MLQKARGGIKVGLTDLDDANLKNVYQESVLVPSPEFDKAEVNPQSLYMGTAFTYLISDWLKLSTDVELSMPKASTGIEDLLQLSAFAKEDIGEAEILLDSSVVYTSNKFKISNSTSEPNSPAVGDLYKKKKGDVLYERKASAWEVSKNVELSYLVDKYMSSSNGLATAGKSITINKSETQPTGSSDNDVWVKASDKSLKVYKNSAYADRSTTIKIGSKFHPESINLKTGFAKIITQRQSYNMKGLVGDFSLSANTGGLSKIKFALQGGVDTVEEKKSNEENFTLPIADTPEFLYLQKANGILANGKVFTANSFELMMNTEISQIKTVDKNEFFITNFKPQIKIKTYLTKENENSFADIKEQKELSLDVYFHDKNAKPKCRILVPKAQSEENATSEADGLLVVDKTYSLMPDKGDDSFSLRFYS